MCIIFENLSVKKKHVFFFRNPGNAKGPSGLNPEADEFVPVFTVLLFFIDSIIDFRFLLA
jgi:hypothetical protein